MIRRLLLITAAAAALAACAAPSKTSSPAAADERKTEVKVLISQQRGEASLKASGPFTLTNLADNKKTKNAAGVFKITAARAPKGALLQLNNDSDYFDIGGAHYRGLLLIMPSPCGAVNIIERIDLEEYLLGVLPYEMSPNWPLEALKAQAVTARTYTLKNLQKSRGKDFDLYSDTRSQMYKGTVKTYDDIKKAISATKGEALKHNGEIFHTYYHANCGGHTNDGGMHNPSDIKPLAGSKCGYCKNSKSHTWARTLPKESVNNYLKKNNIKGEIKSIAVGKTLAGGRAQTLVLTTTREKKEVSCPSFRLAIGPTVLRSCHITKADGLKLEGRGYGHGRGMCQDGARGMALDGKSYKDILHRYYPDAKIMKI